MTNQACKPQSSQNGCEVSHFVADAGKAGVGKDAASATRMSLDEAQKILGISKEAPLEEVLKVLFKHP